MERLDSPPAKLGFRMPPEWYPHAATWLSWPHNQETWPNNLVEAQQEFLALINAIASDERVILNFASSQQVLEARPLLDRLDLDVRRSIHISICPINDAWIRDYGPTFVTKDNQLAAVDWQYNAWGGKYPPFDDDQQFVASMLRLKRPDEPTIFHYNSKLCFEGGGIEVDEAPVAMCTKSCALAVNRNSGWTLESVENELAQCLGIEKIIWLSGDALTGDDTDGHIDQLARFVPGNKIVYATCEDSDDPQHKLLQQNFEDLHSELSRTKLNYELIPLSLPDSVIHDGVRLPASYCNFYVTNLSVVVPQFDQPESDRNACEVVKSTFPNHQVVPLPSCNLCWGLGSFHCLTQQQPQVLRHR